MTFYHFMYAGKYSKPCFHLQHTVYPSTTLIISAVSHSFFLSQEDWKVFVYMSLVHVRDISQSQKLFTTQSQLGYSDKLKYYLAWLSVSNTNACPVKSNKCIPCGFVLTSTLQHLFWAPSVISCYAILLPSSYITNDSRQTHLPGSHTGTMCTLRWQRDVYLSSFIPFSWPITVTACA